MKVLRFLISFLICLCICICDNSSVLAWTVSPVRFEIKGEKGKEYTLTFSVLNESQLYKKRFEIQTDDWTIDKSNNFLRKAFNKEVNNKYSATSWIKITPQQFAIPPGETKTIRFTVTIPNELQGDGEYSAGIFVGEKNIEKPPKGEKIVHIRQDTFIGVVVYVKIGNENPQISLKDLKIDTKPHTMGLNKITLLPVFESTGNVHSRGKITVKMEPLSKLEVTETKKEFNAGEVVVLRESEVIFPVDIPESLKANSEWRFTLSADFGGNTPVLVGTKKFKVPYIEPPVKTNTQKKTEKK